MIEPQTIGEITAGSLAAVRVFESHGIDYCCNGKRSLAEVCREKGIAPESLLAELGAATAARGEGRDWNTAPLRELIEHILSKHHTYLRVELPRLNERLNKVDRKSVV